MTFEPLASDFYGYETLLTDREKEALADLRACLEAEVKPIVERLLGARRVPACRS